VVCPVCSVDSHLLALLKSSTTRIEIKIKRKKITIKMIKKIISKAKVLAMGALLATATIVVAESGSGSGSGAPCPKGQFQCKTTVVVKNGSKTESKTATACCPICYDCLFWSDPFGHYSGCNCGLSCLLCRWTS